MVLPTLSYFHSNPIERLKEGKVTIFLSPSQEKNLYGLGFDEDEDDLTGMNPEKRELAYVAPWGKTAIAASSAGELWGGYAVPEPVVAAAIDKEEDRGKQANMDGRTTARPYSRPTDVSQPWETV